MDLIDRPTPKIVPSEAVPPSRRPAAGAGQDAGATRAEVEWRKARFVASAIMFGLAANLRLSRLSPALVARACAGIA
jgi:hypothetical protein